MPRGAPITTSIYITIIAVLFPFSTKLIAVITIKIITAMMASDIVFVNLLWDS